MDYRLYKHLNNINRIRRNELFMKKTGRPSGRPSLFSNAATTNTDLPPSKKKIVMIVMMMMMNVMTTMMMMMRYHISFDRHHH